eukprot:60668_1
MSSGLILSLYMFYILVINSADLVPKKFVSNTASKSLLCNTCALIAEALNVTLFDDSNAFETNVGFRLDSSGKKIRKNSQWLRIHMKLEDINCQWRKDLFKVAKRNSKLFYLVSQESIKQYQDRNKKNKLKALSEKRDFYLEIKPKLLKKDSKYNKMMDDMCLLITELFDEWLHLKQSKLKNIPQNELKQSLNLTQFCIHDLKYKKKDNICTDDMLNTKMDLSSYKKRLNASPSNATNNISSKLWFACDLALCYVIILTVLALFVIGDASVFMCKLSIIPMLLCPQYISTRNPSFGNASTWWFVWYWYALRFWEIFSNPQFFRDKSFVFCWFHAGAMKNMFKASVTPPQINMEAFVMMIVHILFMSLMHPYIFNELALKTDINDICTVNVYPHIVLKIVEILSFTASILYCIDYGSAFVLNMIGYDIGYDMQSPWKSYSLDEFWGKRWNQFVAYSVRQWVYKPVIHYTRSTNWSLVAVFVILGVIHAFPAYLDGFSLNTVVVVFVWFLIQPLCLFMERKTIKPISFGSHAIDKLVHSFVTFGILFGSLVFSLKSTCYLEQQLK